jgi:hypothetical protein
MDDTLLKVQNWASHGTMRQFMAEIHAKVEGQGYEVGSEGNTLIVSRVQKEGGFLGIGGKTIREPVLRVDYDDEGLAQVDSDSADPEFIAYLAGLLGAH